MPLFCDLCGRPEIPVAAAGGNLCPLIFRQIYLGVWKREYGMLSANGAPPQCFACSDCEKKVVELMNIASLGVLTTVKKRTPWLRKMERKVAKAIESAEISAARRVHDAQKEQWDTARHVKRSRKGH